MSPEQIEELIGDFNLESLPEKASRSKEQDWVHSNLGRQKPVMENCPSIGAWGEYIHALERPKDFYDRYHKVIVEEVSEDQKRIEVHARTTDESIQQILDFCLGAIAAHSGRESSLQTGDFETRCNEQDDTPDAD